MRFRPGGDDGLSAAGASHRGARQLRAGVRPSMRDDRGQFEGSDVAVPAWLRAAGGWSWRLLAMVAAVAVVFFAMVQIQLVCISVFGALVITSVLRPVTNFYARVMPRAIATGLAILSAFGFFAGLLAYVIGSVAGSWNSLVEQFGDGVDRIFEFLEDGPLPVTITSGDVERWIENGRAWIEEHSGDIASQAAASAAPVFRWFAGFALAIFCTVFFLARGKEMWSWFLDQLPGRWREEWTVTAEAGWYTFSGYARGTVMIALTNGILVGVFLAILGVPLPAPLGVLVFIGTFIPLIGAPTAMVIAAVVALAADGVWTALVVTAGIALIGQFEGHVLQPLIMGKQVSLHPIVVALAVTSGTLLAGIVGAVVSVPLVAVAWSVFTTLRSRRRAMLSAGG